MSDAVKQHQSKIRVFATFVATFFVVYLTALGVYVLTYNSYFTAYADYRLASEQSAVVIVIVAFMASLWLASTGITHFVNNTPRQPLTLFLPLVSITAAIAILMTVHIRLFTKVTDRAVNIRDRNRREIHAFELLGKYESKSSSEKRVLEIWLHKDNTASRYFSNRDEETFTAGTWHLHKKTIVATWNSPVRVETYELVGPFGVWKRTSSIPATMDPIEIVIQNNY
jgi:hypothetical protein